MNVYAKYNKYNPTLKINVYFFGFKEKSTIFVLYKHIHYL